MAADLKAELAADPGADLGIGAQRVLEWSHTLSWPAGTAKSIADGWIKGSVTEQQQGARTGTNQN
jgi:hypothetical protein